MTTNKTEKKILFFNSRDELLRIDVSKIVYFEADGNYTNIVTCNKISSTVCMNLGQMEIFLADCLKEEKTLFARIGKRFIINLDCIYKMNSLKKQLVLVDSSNISYQLGISKDAIKNLKNLMIKIRR